MGVTQGRGEITDPFLVLPPMLFFQRAMISPHLRTFAPSLSSFWNSSPESHMAYTIDILCLYNFVCLLSLFSHWKRGP